MRMIYVIYAYETESCLRGDCLRGMPFAQEPEYGPPNGTLVIQGGGSDVDTGIFETFINKAGGLDAKIIVVAHRRRQPDSRR